MQGCEGDQTGESDGEDKQSLSTSEVSDSLISQGIPSQSQSSEPDWTGGEEDPKAGSSPRDTTVGDVLATLSKDLRLGLRERDGYLRAGVGARDAEESKDEEEERRGADNLIGVGQGAGIISAGPGGIRFVTTYRVGGRLSLISALWGGASHQHWRTRGVQRRPRPQAGYASWPCQ